MTPPESLVRHVDPATVHWHGPETVYVRKAYVDHQPVYVICDPDATELATVASRDLAFAVARQNGREPVSVH